MKDFSLPNVHYAVLESLFLMYNINIIAVLIINQIIFKIMAVLDIW